MKHKLYGFTPVNNEDVNQWVMSELQGIIYKLQQQLECNFSNDYPTRQIGFYLQLFKSVVAKINKTKGA